MPFLSKYVSGRSLGIYYSVHTETAEWVLLLSLFPSDKCTSHFTKLILKKENRPIKNERVVLLEVK